MTQHIFDMLTGMRSRDTRDYDRAVESLLASCKRHPGAAAVVEALLSLSDPGDADAPADAAERRGSILYNIGMVLGRSIGSTADLIDAVRQFVSWGLLDDGSFRMRWVVRLHGVAVDADPARSATAYPLFKLVPQDVGTITCADAEAAIRRHKRRHDRYTTITESANFGSEEYDMPACEWERVPIDPDSGFYGETCLHVHVDSLCTLVDNVVRVVPCVAYLRDVSRHLDDGTLTTCRALRTGERVTLWGDDMPIFRTTIPELPTLDGDGWRLARRESVKETT